MTALRSTRLLLPTLVAALVSSGPAAQGRPADARGFYDLFPFGVLRSEYRDGQPTVIVLGTGDGEAEVDAPFDVARDAHHVEIGERRFVYLVSGSSEHGTPSQRGRIAWVQPGLDDPPTITVGGLRELPGVDPFRIAWNRTQGMIYVLDGKDDQVRIAPWSGPPQPLPVSSTFAIAFGPGAAPTLGADLVGLVPIDGGVRILDLYLEGYEAVLDGTTWSFRPYSARTGKESPRWYAAGQRQFPAVGTFDLKMLGGTGPQPWSLVPLLDDVSEPLLTGVHPGDGTTVAVPCPPEFRELPGRPYRIEGGDLRAQTVTPVVSYGAGVSTPRLMVEQDLRIGAEFLCIGVEKFFGATMRVKRVAVAAAPTSLTGYLLIDVREDATTDPVIPAAGGGVTLADPTVMPFTLELPESTDPFTVRWSFDVPAEPALENVVLLFQLVVVDDQGQAAYSAVHASSVLPASASPLLRGAVGSSAASSGYRGTASGYRDRVRHAAATARGEAALRAAWAALDQDPDTGAASPASRQFQRQLRRAMRRD